MFSTKHQSEAPPGNDANGGGRLRKPISSTLKKLRLLRAWTSRYPVWCAWQVTYRCNYHCGFCHYWRDPMGAQPEQTVEQFEEGSRRLASFGSLLVSLAGGEPLLRPDLPDIVRAVARWHLTFVTTNGSLMTRELAEELFAAGAWGVSVSLDYAEARKHDKARGTKQAHERAVAALEVLGKVRRRPWQRVNLMCVLLHDNLDQIEELIRLAERLGVWFMLQPYSDRKTGSDHFRHSNGPVSPKLLALKREHPAFISNPLFLANFDRYFNGGVPDCRAGQAFFNIDSGGDISICVEERHRPVANLYRHSPRRIIEGLQAARAENTCTACWYNCRGEVECLYRPKSLLQSLHWFFRDRPGSGNGHGRPVR